MVYIYAIKLEKGKYYIGKTSNPHFRLQSHFDSNGSSWTKKYEPLKVIEILPIVMIMMKIKLQRNIWTNME